MRKMRISLDIDVSVKDGVLVLTAPDGGLVTFSRHQAPQRKVSMVTFGELSDLPRIQIANAFGFATRKSYYDARTAVLRGTLEDLLPKKTGPSHPVKRTRDLELLVIQMRCQTDHNMYQIAEELARLGFQVSARLVASILADYGLSKKNGSSR